MYGDTEVWCADW